MKKSFMVLFLLAAAFLQAEETKKLDSADVWEQNPAVSCRDGVFTVNGKIQLMAAETISIDPEKTFKFTVSCRAVKGANPAFMPVIMQYDKKGRVVSVARVDVIGGTFTQLLAPVKSGDTSILVKDATLWIRKRLLVIAFDAKEDYSDLPNSRLNWNTITGISEENGSFRVQLAQKIPFNAGKCGVRLHNNGSALMYPVGGKNLQDQWITFSGSITGRERKAFSNRKWAPGAVTARFGLQINFNNPDGVTEFKDAAFSVE